MGEAPTWACVSADREFAEALTDSGELGAPQVEAAAQLTSVYWTVARHQQLSLVVLGPDPVLLFLLLTCLAFCTFGRAGCDKGQHWVVVDGVWFGHVTVARDQDHWVVVDGGWVVHITGVRHQGSLEVNNERVAGQGSVCVRSNSRRRTFTLTQQVSSYCYS